MAIGALSSSPALSHFPGATALDGATDRARQAPRVSSGTNRGPAGSPSSAADPARDSARNSAVETARKALRESREAEQAQASAASSKPRVQFKDSEGTRVMEVYDSKNILIYQVPPKGQLTLIQSQEHQSNPRVETSA